MSTVQADQLRKEIRRAFPGSRWGNGTQGQSALSHQAIVDMRQQLPLMESQDVVQYLPLVLDDVLAIGDDPVQAAEAADLVVYFLDVLDVPGVEDRGPYSPLEWMVLKKASFQLLSVDQSRTITAWLGVIAEWGVFQFCAESIRRASAYWEGRIS